MSTHLQGHLDVSPPNRGEQAQTNKNIESRAEKGAHNIVPEFWGWNPSRQKGQVEGDMWGIDMSTSTYPNKSGELGAALQGPATDRAGEQRMDFVLPGIL
jgi:hypothetical protein